MKSNSRFLNKYSLGLQNSPLILLPSIFICISLGFLGLLVAKHAYYEIKAVEFEDTPFLSLKIVLGIAAISGFFLRRLIRQLYKEYLEISLILLNIIIIYVIMNFSSGILQVDYIFHTNLFQLFAYILLFTAGYFLGSLKKLRLWGFLVGAVSVFGYSYLYKSPELNTEEYLIPIICLLLTEICLYSFLMGYEIESSKKGRYRGNHFTTDIFFYSGITLLVTHSLLYYYRSSGGPDALVAGGGLGFLIFNIIQNMNLLRRKVRIMYLGGRIIIFLNLILTIQQAYVELFYFWLFFLDLASMAIFRPKEYSARYLSLGIVSGLIIAYVCYLLHLNYTKSEFLYAYLLVIVNLVWIPLILKNSFGILQKLVLLGVSYVFCIYFFSPLPYNYKIQRTTNENIIPIPFLMSSVELNNQDFVFYNTGLPFNKSDMLPKRNEFKNKTVVLGIKDNPEIILTYVKYLAKNSYSYIIYQSKSLPRLTREEILFSYQEFPLFRIYYPEKGIPGLNSLQPGLPSRIYESDPVEQKLKELNTNEEIESTINSLIKSGNSENQKLALSYQEKFFRSYMKYADYFFEIKDYRMAIKMAELALKFDSGNTSLFDTTYESLIRISPEKEHISIMNFLISKPKYKKEVLKRLYPLLLSTGDEKNALMRMDELITILNSENLPQESKIVLLEKIKILIKLQRYSEVEEIISKEKKKADTMDIWEKLTADVKYYKETSSKPYYYGFKGPSELPTYNVGENY